MGQQRGVVARAGADVQDHVAFLRSKLVEAAGVQARLADVDAARRVECDQRVLVEERRVVIRRADVSIQSDRTRRPGAEREDVPGPGSRKWLARHGGEGLLDPRVVRTALGGHVAGKEGPQVGAAVYHRAGIS